MPKRGENIRKRKDGRWEGRYKRQTMLNGKTQYGSVYGKTYKEVKEKLKELGLAGRLVAFWESRLRVSEVMS